MKTHEEHARRVRLKHGARVEIAGIYTRSKTRVKYRCPDHGFWSALPSNVEAGDGCSSCRKEERRSEYEKRHCEEIRKIHGDRVLMFGPYMGANIHNLYRCPDHGLWRAKPANVVHRKSGCPECYYATISNRCRKTNATYKTELKPLGIKALGEYEVAHKPILHKCSEGHLWESSPNQILSGYGCPRCDNSQYRRRPVQVGTRNVLLQGSEPTAVHLMLDSGCDPDDFVFSVRGGKPTFRYRFKGKCRTYVPDFLIRPDNLVVEVKSVVTLGLYDRDLYRQVQAKSRSVLRSEYKFQLIVVHRGRNLNIGRGWHRLPWPEITKRIRRKQNDQDLRY